MILEYIVKYLRNDVSYLFKILSEHNNTFFFSSFVDEMDTSVDPIEKQRDGSE